MLSNYERTPNALSSEERVALIAAYQLSRAPPIRFGQHGSFPVVEASAVAE